MKAKVTDRAKRYRAQRAVTQRARLCIYCGQNPERLDVEHVDGNEGDGRPDNLALACRPCNARKGHAFARAGVGIRTVQMNPARGARSLKDWRRAVDVLLGYARGSLVKAVSLVRSTPPDRRAELAREARAAAAKALRPNPDSPGAQSLGAWVAALEAAHQAKREGRNDKAARKLIEDTPAWRRSEFNREVWRRRKEHLGEVPF